MSVTDSISNDKVYDYTLIDADTYPLMSKTSSCGTKGLGSIVDSIKPHHEGTQAKKSNFFKRIPFTISLFILDVITINLQLIDWVLKTFFGFSSGQKALYRDLYRISKNGSIQEIREFLHDNSRHASVAGYLFSELLDIPETHSYLTDILEGANICLEDDNGFFCRRWAEHPDSHRRISSHKSKNKECYAIGHFLFWLDLDGNTRFQFENSPLKGLFSSINHFIDYLRYRRDNEQQGIIGTSKYTEDYCLKIQIDVNRT